MSDNEQLRMLFAFQFPFSKIPYGKAYKREVVAVLSPTSQLIRPDMREEEFTRGLTQINVKRLLWDANDDSEQHLSLEINQDFLIFANVYGEFNDNSQKNKSSTTNNTYISFRCQQKMINTYTFNCDSGQTISASKVCNSVPDCKDGSDEKDERCMVQGELVWWITCQILAISIVSYLITSIYRYWDEKKQVAAIQQNVANTLTMVDNHTNEEGDVFSIIYPACVSIQEYLKEPESKDNTIESILEPIITLYKDRHRLKKEERNKAEG